MKIQIKDLHKTYRLQKGQPLTVLSGINLDIEAGDFIIIQGESGCGKSTLLNLIAGLAFPSAGEILVDGNPVTGPHPSRMLLFQQPSLLPWATVEENISFGCKIRRETSRLKERTQQSIQLMGLEGVEKNYPAELSVGMAHRVCIARALLASPDILLLDEPFRSLDTVNSIRLMNELIDIWKKEKFTAVFVTHNIEESVMLGNKIVLLGSKPTKIIETVNLDLPHPRHISDESFVAMKTMIYEKCREAGRRTA